jgi:hypothetical protein
MSYFIEFSNRFGVFYLWEQINLEPFRYKFPTLTMWFHTIFILFANIFLFFGKFINIPWELCLDWHHSQSSSMIFPLLFDRKRKDNSYNLAWIFYKIPCIIQDFLTDNVINSLLIDILIGCRIHIPILS